MQYNAKVVIRRSEYMEDGYTLNEFFVTVEASSDEEAEDKIYKHYDDKSDRYGTMYMVSHINLFVRID